ncbi:MAG: hypothetical protein FWC39_07160 [Bacteroidetes bacterium]|nr:hypothetical protein [Bacteroidota bacterium]
MIATYDCFSAKLHKIGLIDKNYVAFTRRIEDLFHLFHSSQGVAIGLGYIGFQPIKSRSIHATA